MPFDTIIVGSGFGGAVAALRMAEAGMRVLVLERGRRWTRDTLPRAPDDPGFGITPTRNSGTDGSTFASFPT